MEWKELYPKSNKPRIEDIENYLDDESVVLFRKFTKHLMDGYQLTYVLPAYSNVVGWKYQYGRSGYVMLRNVCFHDHRFSIEGIDIVDRAAYEKATQLVDEIYNDKFLSEYAQFDAKRKKRQKDRAQKKKERDQLQKEALKGKITPEKFNVYQWAPAVSRAKLRRLYENDAKGLVDSDLLDEVGYSIYARCLQGKEERALMEQHKIKCHHCGKILTHNYDVVTCKCGYQYTYKEYRKSLRTHSMPTGAAQQLFSDFIDKWSTAKEDATKMRLIDNLIHEFHFNIGSGAKGRPVGFNLIQGTNRQVIDLILHLAYGDSSNANMENRDYWLSNIQSRLDK